MTTDTGNAPGAVGDGAVFGSGDCPAHVESLSARARDDADTPAVEEDYEAQSLQQMIRLLVEV